MNGAVTWEVVGLIATVVTGALGLWWIIESRITEVRDELAHFKESVLKEYASVSHLEKVENKLIASLDNLTKEVKELTRILYNRGKDDASR